MIKPGSDRSERFYTLDMIRGVACLLVLWMHYSDASPLNILPGSWMAVDLFFILSGVVVTHVVETERVKYNSTMTFIVLRVKRLYPSYLMGLIIGVAAYGVASARGYLPPNDLFRIARDALFGVFLIPDLTATHTLLPSLVLRDNSIYPLNAPSWTLFFELLVNVMFVPAYFGPKSIRKLYLVAIATSFFAYLAVVMATKTGNNGWSPNNIPAGVLRVFAEYGIGYLFYRHKNLMGRWPKFGYLKVLLVSSAIAIVCIWTHNPIFRIVNYFVLPVVIISGFLVELRSPRVIRVARWLGSISYPLYIVHVPVLSLILPFSSVKLIPRIVCAIIAATVAVVMTQIERALGRRRPKMLATIQV